MCRIRNNNNDINVGILQIDFIDRLYETKIVLTGRKRFPFRFKENKKEDPQNNIFLNSIKVILNKYDLYNTV